MRLLTLFVLLIFQLYSGTASHISAAFYVAQAYNCSTNRAFAAWVDEDSEQIFYASYTDIDQWSSPSIVDPTAISSTPPALCYDPCSGTMLLAWADLDRGLPMYSIYDGDHWTNPKPISTTQHCCVLISLSVTKNEILATWMNNRNNSFPIYATYIDGVWSEASEITTDLDFRAHQAIVSSYDEANQLVLAVWRSFASNQPLYATYKQGVWTAPDLLAPLSEGPDNCVPIYGIYRNDSWVVTYCPSTAFSTFQSDALLIYNPLNQEIFASWENSPPASPIHAVFQNDNWRETPTDKIVREPPPLVYSVTELTVENLAAKRQRHHFGFVTEWYNAISWAANPSPKVAGYHIYRNGVRITSVPANVLSYEDHNQKRRAAITYHVTIFDRHNNESPSTSVTIQKNR
jgi:hypothetical protein